MSYADSLRQQAAWVREALDPATPETQRITLDDIDVEELDAAAAKLDALPALVEALQNLLRFVEEGSVYELQHPSDYSAYLNAKAELSALRAEEGKS